MIKLTMAILTVVIPIILGEILYRLTKENKEEGEEVMHDSPYEESFTPEMMDMIATDQANLFEYAEKQGLDMHAFIREYMTSTFCNQEMDADCSYFHFKPDTVLFAYIEGECSLKKKGDSDAIENPGWVGWMYRRLVFELDIPSRELVYKIEPEILDQLAAQYELYESSEAVRAVAEIVRNF